MKLVLESMYLEKADVCSVWGSWEPSGMFMWEGGIEAKSWRPERGRMSRSWGVLKIGND